MTTITGQKYKNLLDVLAAEYDLQPGYEFGIRSVHPDLASSRGFVWPMPGEWASAVGTKGGECPSMVGDGLCTARTWRGMASGGIPAITLLLTAHETASILGQTEGKVRASNIFVVAIVDGARLIREHGGGADLGGANLGGANLRGANLRGADLGGANLRGANLGGADLRGADLRGANLGGANLGGANLRGADLRGADLRGADLRGADLREAVGYVVQ